MIRSVISNAIPHSPGPPGKLLQQAIAAPPAPSRSIPRRRDPCTVRSRGNRSWDSPRRARTARHQSGSCTCMRPGYRRGHGTG